MPLVVLVDMWAGLWVDLKVVDWAVMSVESAEK